MTKTPTAPSLGNALGLSSTVTVVKAAPKAKDIVSKKEGQLLRSNALSVEDGDQSAFDQLGKGKVLRPTYDPILMSVLCQQNNTLLQCIEAMCVNVDGTGYDIERTDGEPVTDKDKKQIEQLKQFFDEPYPGESFLYQRRQLRQHLESTGCAYIEVIRNEGGKIVFMRPLDAKLMRLVALDAPVLVQKKVMRFGTEQTVNMVARERRFAMQVGTKLRFFKEFGASRDVDMLTGEWVNADGTRVAGTSVIDPTANGLPGQGTNLLQINQSGGGGALGLAAATGQSSGSATASNNVLAGVPLIKGTEVIYFGAVPDVGTGYYVPRWINQVPSVLGSRKAEEFNLEFFNSGGLPPALVLVQGGVLDPASRTALTNYLAGKAKYKQRGVIAEVYPASGDIGSTGSVKVTVERFGDERQKDSMFGNYDQRCADHVRGSFRLPQLFIGNSQDQNFATAKASYMVAEAQVFKPERESFDEIINVKVMKEIAPDYYFRSLPMQVADPEMQLKALELGKDSAEPESFLKAVNEIGSVTLDPREDLDEEAAMGVVNQMLGRDALGGKLDRKDQKGLEDKDGKPAKVSAGKNGLIAKMDDDILHDLANDWADHLSGRKEFEPASVAVMLKLMKSLEPQVRKLLNSYVAIQLTDAKHDVDGVSQLIARAGECLDHAEA